MAGMNPPQIPDEPPPVLNDDELRRLLKACEGRDFTDRRDAAILRLFLDTGVRVSEAAGIMLPGDLDLDDQVVIVLGKGRRPRAVPFGRKTALPWIAICGYAPATRSPTCRTCGSVRPGP
jgi:integrase/recombinase XerC